MAQTDETLFWDLIEELQHEDPRVEEGTIMGGRCARVAGEFLGLVDYKGSGMVVKLPKARVAELIDDESERERHFKPEWRDFYVDRQHGPDFVLIRLVPFRLEIVSIVHGIASDPMGWRPRIVDLPVEP